MIGVLFIILAKLLQENPGLLEWQSGAQHWLYAFGIGYVAIVGGLYLLALFTD